MLRTAEHKPFYRGLFDTMVIGGTFLGGSGLVFRNNSMNELIAYKAAFAANPQQFLTERVDAAAGYQSHFSGLVKIWVSAILILSLLCLFLFRYKTIAGALIGLIICCLLSLGLDYFGYRSDGPYYLALKELTASK